MRLESRVPVRTMSSDKMEKTISRYRNRAIETVQVIEELRAGEGDEAAQKRGYDLKQAELLAASWAA